jgi:hypothetical protein
MAVDRRLLGLHDALRRCSPRPSNRTVIMVARVTPALGVGIRDLPGPGPWRQDTRRPGAADLD